MAAGEIIMANSSWMSAGSSGSVRRSTVVKRSSSGISETRSVLRIGPGVGVELTTDVPVSSH